MVILYTRTDPNGSQYQIYANCNLSDLVANNIDNTIFIQSRLNATPKYYCYNSAFFWGTVTDGTITRKYMLCCFIPKVSCSVYSRSRQNSSSSWSTPTQLYSFNVNNDHSCYVQQKAGANSEILITSSYYGTYQFLSTITSDYYNTTNTTTFTSDLETFTNYTDYNNWITNIAPPTYTWQSVAGVSGKGQTYSLSQIANINNGESVTGASASAFTSLTAQVSTMVTDDSAMSGADAGGISGSGSNSGDQSSGYAFGQGESGTNVSGGGGGYYGGEKGGSLLSGGAGSGYIGNSLVSNKKMVGYNVPTSSAESTKTESVSVYSATKEANKPKAGNGFARIKLLSTSRDYNFTDIIKTLDMTHIKHTSGNVSNLSEYYLTDWILNSGINSQQTLSYSNGVFAISDGGGVVSYPITRLNGVSKVTFKARRTNHSISFDGCFFNVIDGVRTVVGSFSGSLNTDWKTFTVTIDNNIVDYFEVYAGGGYGDNVQISDVVFTSV